MTIAIDIDNTWTKEPKFWNLFYNLCCAQGHELICVTNRETRTDDIVRFNIPTDIIFCGSGYKKDFCESIGLKVDIWIDDLPGTIERGRYLDGEP